MRMILGSFGCCLLMLTSPVHAEYVGSTNCDPDGFGGLRCRSYRPAPSTGDLLLQHVLNQRASQPQVVVVPTQYPPPTSPAPSYIPLDDQEQLSALISAGAYACPLGGEIFLLTPEEKAYVRSGIKIPCKNHAHISLEPIAVVASQRGYSVPSSTQSGTKFCPTGGELYGADIKYCPNHGVELRWKQ